MYGKLETSNLVTINSYHEARDYYEKTNPIRGYEKQICGVPLRHNRRYVNTSLREYDGDMVIRLYNTNIVTWHKDGETITIDATYDSKFTRSYINFYMGKQAFVMGRYGCNCLSLNDKYYVCNKPLTIKKINNAWELITPPTIMQVERLDRTIAAKIRKENKEFYDYLATMCAIDIDKNAYYSMAESDIQFVRDFYRYSSFREVNGPNRTIKINYEITKKRYTDAKFKEGGAYYFKELPAGEIYREMKIKKEK